MSFVVCIPVFILFSCLVVRCLRGFGLRIPVVSGWFAEDRLYSCLVDKRDTRNVFVLSLVFRVVMLGAMFVGYIVMTNGQSFVFDDFVNLFNIWDAGHYGNLVRLGYDGFTEDGQHYFLVFFPLYVWLTRFVKLFVGNTVIAGLIVSFLSYAVGCCYMYRIAAKFMDRYAAYDSVVLMSVFPWSFFFRYGDDGEPVPVHGYGVVLLCIGT